MQNLLWKTSAHLNVIKATERFTMINDDESRLSLSLSLSLLGNILSTIGLNVVGIQQRLGRLTSKSKVLIKIDLPPCSKDVHCCGPRQCIPYSLIPRYSAVLQAYQRNRNSIETEKHLIAINFIIRRGSSINDVTQFWTIFDPPPPLSRFITKALALSSQNPRPSPPLRPWRHLWIVIKPYTNWITKSKQRFTALNVGCFLSNADGYS